jgi:hypothetical protein
MNHSRTVGQPSAQSSYLSIACGIFVAVAIMAGFYFLVTEGPSLVDANAFVYRAFDNSAQALKVLGSFVVWFSLALQVVQAVACVHVSKRLTGKKKVDHAWISVLWLLHPLVLFFASLLAGLVYFDPEALRTFAAYPNLEILRAMFVIGLLFAGALGVSIGLAHDTDNPAAKGMMNNPMFALAVCKSFLLFLFACQSLSLLTATLVLGSYVLDFLLYPLGEKIRATTAE